MSRKIRENTVYSPIGREGGDRVGKGVFVHGISPLKTGGVRQEITDFLDKIPCDTTGDGDCKTVVAQVKAAIPPKKPEFNPTQVVKIGSGGNIRREHNGFMGFLGARDREMFDMISEGK